MFIMIYLLSLLIFCWSCVTMVYMCRPYRLPVLHVHVHVCIWPGGHMRVVLYCTCTGGTVNIYYVNVQCCTSPDHGTSQSPRCGLGSSPSLFPWQQCSMFLNESWIQFDSERSHTFQLCSWLSYHHGSFLLLVTPLQTDLKHTNIICAETIQIPDLLLTLDKIKSVFLLLFWTNTLLDYSHFHC